MELRRLDTRWLGSAVTYTRTRTTAARVDRAKRPTSPSTMLAKVPSVLGVHDLAQLGRSVWCQQGTMYEFQL